jgi:hypothetical protein
MSNYKAKRIPPGKPKKINGSKAQNIMLLDNNKKRPTQYLNWSFYLSFKSNSYETLFIEKY